METETEGIQKEEVMKTWEVIVLPFPGIIRHELNIVCSSGPYYLRRMWRNWRRLRGKQQNNKGEERLRELGTFSLVKMRKGGELERSCFFFPNI